MQRYASLARKDAPRPFVRTTSKRRVVDSAYAWISGLADMSGRRVIPEGPLIISDAPGSNNSIHSAGAQFNAGADSCRLVSGHRLRTDAGRVEHLGIGVGAADRGPAQQARSWRHVDSL